MDRLRMRSSVGSERSETEYSGGKGNTTVYQSSCQRCKNPVRSRSRKDYVFTNGSVSFYSQDEKIENWLNPRSTQKASSSKSGMKKECNNTKLFSSFKTGKPILVKDQSDFLTGMAEGEPRAEKKRPSTANKVLASSQRLPLSATRTPSEPIIGQIGGRGRVDDYLSKLDCLFEALQIDDAQEPVSTTPQKKHFPHMTTSYVFGSPFGYKNNETKRLTSGILSHEGQELKHWKTFLSKSKALMQEYWKNKCPEFYCENEAVKKTPEAAVNETMPLR